MRQERPVTRLDHHYLRSSADGAIDDVGFIEAAQPRPIAIGCSFRARTGRAVGARHDVGADSIRAIGFHGRLGTDGGGGAVIVTVLVISSVDVSVVTAVWLDPPQPARTIAAPAIAVVFPRIEGGYARGVMSSRRFRGKGNVASSLLCGHPCSPKEPNRSQPPPVCCQPCGDGLVSRHRPDRRLCSGLKPSRSLAARARGS
jgi:hypothetical protein